MKRLKIQSSIQFVLILCTGYQFGFEISGVKLGLSSLRASLSQAHAQMKGILCLGYLTPHVV